MAMCLKTAGFAYADEAPKPSQFINCPTEMIRHFFYRPDKAYMFQVSIQIDKKKFCKRIKRNRRIS